MPWLSDLSLPAPCGLALSRLVYSHLVLCLVSSCFVSTRLILFYFVLSRLVLPGLVLSRLVTLVSFCFVVFCLDLFGLILSWFVSSCSACVVVFSLVLSSFVFSALRFEGRPQNKPSVSMVVILSPAVLSKLHTVTPVQVLMFSIQEILGLSRACDPDVPFIIPFSIK